MSPREAYEIAMRVRRNECGNCHRKTDGLLFWNKDEPYPSIGIGHFIWFPPGSNPGFEERFPAFVEFARKAGANVPAWLIQNEEVTFPPEWKDRQAFVNAAHPGRMSEKMSQLHNFLADSVDLQAQFIASRLSDSFAEIQKATGTFAKKSIREKIINLIATPAGTYAATDYDNFKGWGEERRNGIGWGLRQVLEGMPEGGGENPLEAFRASAIRVLTERVNSLQDKKQRATEEKWLEGWKKRINTYR